MRPASIEARGWKDGKQVMTARRDTTGPAARLVLATDRDSLSADGEDVAMFAVEVQDANGRTVPITDNLVTFKVTGPAKLIGTGNGDPTDQAPDKGISRKAFSGYCMAIVQAEKSPGDHHGRGHGPRCDVRNRNCLKQTDRTAPASHRLAAAHSQGLWHHGSVGSCIGAWYRHGGFVPGFASHLHAHAGRRKTHRHRRRAGRLVRWRRCTGPGC